MKKLQIAVQGRTPITLGRSRRLTVCGLRGFARVLALPFMVSLILCAQVAAKGCLLEQKLSDTSPRELLSGYLTVALDANYCYSLGSGHASCTPRIDRQLTDFYVGISGADAFTQPELDTVGRQISLTNSEILEITGVQGYAVPRSKNHGMVALVFVDSVKALKEPELYAEIELPQLNLGSPDQLGVFLSAFLRDGKTDCMTLNRVDNPGRILISSTWIKSELALPAINRCIARAFVGGLGLNADSLFTSEIPDNGSYVGDDLFALPVKYRAFLEIHYSRLIQPGTTRDQIESSAQLREELECDH